MVQGIQRAITLYSRRARGGPKIHVGDLSLRGGGHFPPHLSHRSGRDVDVAGAQEAAKWCAMNVLAQAKAAAGGWDNLARLAKITVFVASTPDFTEQHLVANGASDFLAEVLGERGRHARSAVGMASLPLDAPVEIEAIIEVDD